MHISVITSNMNSDEYANVCVVGFRQLQSGIFGILYGSHYACIYMDELMLDKNHRAYVL